MNTYSHVIPALEREGGRPAGAAARRLTRTAVRELGYKLGCKPHDAGPAPSSETGVFVLRMMEATTGFEPVYTVLQTAPWPLGHVATSLEPGCPARIRTSVHGSKVRCPAS